MTPDELDQWRWNHAKKVGRVPGVVNYVNVAAEEYRRLVRENVRPEKPDIGEQSPLSASQEADGRQAPKPKTAEQLPMTDDQIKHMVNRFLEWKLPKPFNPDNWISFDPPKPINSGTPYENDLWPTGTNLFDAIQAEAMVRYMAEGMPKPETAEPVAADWWKPEPGDPYWLLEVRQGFDNAGAWLKNEHSCLTTTAAHKAIRYPSQWHADVSRRNLHNPYHTHFEPTEHVDTAPVHPSTDVVEAGRGCHQLHYADKATDAIFDLVDQSTAAQAVEIERLKSEVVKADHSRTCYARALEKMRIALVNINDGLEDEGDRIYLGSTNHADDIRAAWQVADALRWDELLEHTQPQTPIADTNLKLQATIDLLRKEKAALEAELARLEKETIERCADVADVVGEREWRGSNPNSRMACDEIATAIRALPPEYGA